MVDFGLAADGTLFIKSASSAWTYASSTLTQVNDADYPATTVRGVVYLNGYFYVMDASGQIWNSAEDDPTTWAATDFVTAEFESDGGVALAKHGQYVIALGTFTTEAFYDGNTGAGSPLLPVDTGVLLIGCAHANSVAQIEQSLVWVAQQKGQGSTYHRGRFVVTMEGMSYKRISTPDVERILDADTFSEVYADIVVNSGHAFYVLTLTASSLTLIYDFKTNLWMEWSLSKVKAAVTVSTLTQASGTATATATSHGFSDGDHVTIAGATPSGYNLTVNVTYVDADTFTYPVSAALSSPATGTITATGYSKNALDITQSVYFDNQQLVQLESNGKIYALDPTTTSDNGAPIDLHIVSDIIDNGTLDRKFVGSFRVVCDSVDTTGLLRWTDDDYSTYTNYRRLTMDSLKPIINRCGSFRRRAVEFRHTLAAQVSILGIEADIIEGDGNG